MRKALVVGINDYPNAPLRGCVNDANAMTSVLATHGDGSPNFDVRLITSPSDTIDRANLRRAINDLFDGDSDIALLYFSGHGHIGNTGGHIVTTDARRYDEGVSMDDILTLANQSRAKNKVILFDCCHSGALGSPAVGGHERAILSEGMTVLTASRSGEPALEMNGRGIFTALVVDALQGGAADLRGEITPGAIYAYVDQALGPWDQRPIFKTNVTRFTTLRSTPPPIPREILRRICEYFPNPHDEHRLNPTYETTDPTADSLNVQILKELQKFERVGLVVPVGEEHMYYAAINSKSCRLTALGFQYWRLVKERRI